MYKQLVVQFANCLDAGMETPLVSPAQPMCTSSESEPSTPQKKSIESTGITSLSQLLPPIVSQATKFSQVKVHASSSTLRK